MKKDMQDMYGDLILYELLCVSVFCQTQKFNACELRFISIFKQFFESFHVYSAFSVHVN